MMTSRKIALGLGLWVAVAAGTGVARAEPGPVERTGGGAADLLGVTRTPPELSGADRRDENTRVAVGCTAPDGTLLRQGELGYERCLSEAQSQRKGSGSKAGLSVTRDSGSH